MKYLIKISLAAVVVSVVLIGSVIYVTQLLKEEVEKNHLNNAKLHVSSFKMQINQTISTINKSIDHIGMVVDTPKLVNQRINGLLSEYQFIRSINVTDDTNKIIYSSNPNNLHKVYSIDNYYPKPMFYKSMLRFGLALNARDIFEKNDFLSAMSFGKEIINNNKNYHIIIVISNDYFINQYADNLHEGIETLEIIRVDGNVLLSTGATFMENKKNTETFLYKQAMEKSISSGTEIINTTKYISAYSLADLYPLAIVIRLDYKKLMKNWESKNIFALLFISLLICFIAFVIVYLIVKYSKTKDKELAYKTKLIKNQEKLKNAYIVYDNTNDGILITDKNKNIIDVNNAFVLNTGYTKEEVYGQNPRILKSYSHNKEFYEKMWENVEKFNFWHGEIVNKNKNSLLYTELLTINKVCDKDGNVKHYIGVFTNISKEKEQESLLKEKERFIFQQSKMAAMGEMLENIAHQWRQPLSVISTAATGIKMEKEFGISTESVELERLTLINDSAQFLSQTIDDFRNFFKPKKDKEAFFIEEMIDKTLNIVSSKFKNRNIQMIKNIDTIKIIGYESELIQVIMNILNNARDILEEKEIEDRLVFINSFIQDTDVIITIKDTGGGIDKDVISKIFEPYFTTKHQSQGTGIGLYMSEEIIKKHMNGSISVDNNIFTYNDKEYTGAMFTLTIPLKEIKHMVC